MSRTGLHALIAVLALGLAGCSQPGPASTATATPPPPPQNNATVGQEIGAAIRDRLIVSFASGSDQLMPDADKQLDIAARLFRDVRPVSMYATGYSDASGSEFENLLLSARRARTVKAALVARGIPANQILLRAFGQSDPIDKSHPDAPENRRVAVTWDIM